MRIIVIGAGAAGMGASIMLAGRGLNVTLCEAGPRVAPLLRGFSRQGYHFDTGFHCAGTLGPGGALNRYLRMIGVKKHLRLVPMRPDCIELYRFFKDSPLDFCLPQNVDEAVEAFARHWPEQRENVRAFYADMKEKFSHSAFTNPDMRGFDLSGLRETESLEQYMSGFNMPERLKSILCAHAVFMGTGLEEISVDEFALVSHSMYEDLHFIAGGGMALAHAFEAELAACGVEVLAPAKVDEILVKDGKVAGVRLEQGGIMECDGCVYTAHPSALASMLPKNALRPSMLAHLQTLRDTGRAFSLYGITSSKFTAGSFIYLCASDYINDALKSPPGENSWLTLSSTEVYPNGKYAVAATLNLPGGMDKAGDLPLMPKNAEWRPDYTACKKELEKWVRERIVSCIPELGDFEVLDSSTDHTMQKWVCGSTGSIYGVLHSLGQMPVLPRTRVGGLVLAGQGIILPGLLGALVSAALAVGLLTGFEDIFEDFRDAKA